MYEEKLNEKAQVNKCMPCCVRDEGGVRRGVQRRQKSSCMVECVGVDGVLHTTGNEWHERP